LGRTVDEQNVITIDCGWRQPITLSGPGAGGAPTAHALLGDLLCC
jgi:homoserine dehydrogenase